MAELLEKIPAEKRWAITAKTLLGLAALQGEKIVAPEMGKGEGWIAPVLGAQKWIEINMKVFAEGIVQMYPWVKETFNIPVEDAIGAANLGLVTLILSGGPEMEYEYLEATPERCKVRVTQCPYMKRYNEFEVNPEFIPCVHGHQLHQEYALKAIIPKITYMLTKAMPRGDSYCEEVYEFKDE